VRVPQVLADRHLRALIVDRAREFLPRPAVANIPDARGWEAVARKGGLAREEAVVLYA